MVNVARKVHTSLGSSEKKFLKSEKTLHGILIRKFVVKKNIKKNEKLNKNNIKTALTYSREGILPKNYYQIIKKKAKKDLKSGHILKLSDLK